MVDEKMLRADEIGREHKNTTCTKAVYKTEMWMGLLNYESTFLLTRSFMG